MASSFLAFGGGFFISVGTGAALKPSFCRQRFYGHLDRRATADADFCLSRDTGFLIFGHNDGPWRGKALASAEKKKAKTKCEGPCGAQGPTWEGTRPRSRLPAPGNGDPTADVTTAVGARFGRRARSPLPFEPGCLLLDRPAFVRARPRDGACAAAGLHGRGSRRPRARAAAREPRGPSLSAAPRPETKAPLRDRTASSPGPSWTLLGLVRAAPPTTATGAHELVPTA